MLYDSIYMKFSDREDCIDGEHVSNCQKLGIVGGYDY